MQATVFDVDFSRRTVRFALNGEERELAWDRLALTTGSVTRVIPTPGLDVHALGLTNLAEATYIHDHVLRQLERADATDDPAQRRAHLTFVVVGAGYTGTETAAQIQWMTVRQLDRFPRLSTADLRWLLLDMAPTALPELGQRLGRKALEVVGGRGIEVRLQTGVSAMDEDGVTLTDGTRIPTRTVLGPSVSSHRH